MTDPDDGIPPEGHDAVVATPMVTHEMVPTPMGVMRFSPAVEAIFNLEPREGEIHIRDTGEVYIPQQIYRNRLFEAFGPGGWGLRQISLHREGNIAYFEGALVANNQVIAQAIGEMEYFTNNPNGKWTHAVDAAKSQCLKKCCKDLVPGFNKLWDKAWTDRWRDKHAYEHWREQKKGSRDNKPKWRRKDMKPHRLETGPTKGQQQRDSGAPARAPASTSGAKGSAALREAEGLEPLQESPAASEARRIEFQEAIHVPIDLSASDLEHIIGLADTVEQLNDPEMLRQLKALGIDARARLKEIWGARRHALGGNGGDPQGERQ